MHGYRLCNIQLSTFNIQLSSKDAFRGRFNSKWKLNVVSETGSLVSYTDIQFRQINSLPFCFAGDEGFLAQRFFIAVSDLVAIEVERGPGVQRRSRSTIVIT